MALKWGALARHPSPLPPSTPPPVSLPCLHLPHPQPPPIGLLLTLRFHAGSAPPSPTSLMTRSHKSLGYHRLGRHQACRPLVLCQTTTLLIFLIAGVHLASLLVSILRSIALNPHVGQLPYHRSLCTVLGRPHLGEAAPASPPDSAMSFRSTSTSSTPLFPHRLHLLPPNLTTLIGDGENRLGHDFIAATQSALAQVCKSTATLGSSTFIIVSKGQFFFSTPPSD